MWFVCLSRVSGSHGVFLNQVPVYYCRCSGFGITQMDTTAGRRIRILSEFGLLTIPYYSCALCVRSHDRYRY